MVQWLALIFFCAAAVFAIVWNVLANSWLPGFFPEADTSPLDTEHCRDMYLG